MNAKLKVVFDRVETWPEQAQEQALDLLLAVEHEYAEPYQLSEEDKAAIDRSLDDARNGRFATDEQVAAVFDRYRHK